MPPLVDLNGIDFVEVDPADHRILRVSFLKPVPAGVYGVTADRRRRHDRRRHAHRRDQGDGCDDRDGSVLRIDVTRGGDFSPYVARPCRTIRASIRCGAARVLVHGELPDRRRLPAGAVPAGGARRAAARLPRQGLRELPPDARRPAADAEPRLDRAQPVRPRHGPPGAARLRQATASPTSRTPSRTRRTSTPCGTASRPAATRSSSTTGCTTAATRGPPVHVTVNGTATLRAGTALFTKILRRCPASHAARPPDPGRRARRSTARRALPPRRRRVRDGVHADVRTRQQRDPRPHVGRGGVLPAGRDDRGVALRGHNGDTRSGRSSPPATT